MLVVTPITVGLSLLLAVALNSKIHFRGLFQTLYFLPYVSSTVAIGIVWSWIFHSRYGILNYILGRFGIAPVQWLNDPHTAMAALIIFSIWKGLSFDIVIFLAGLQNIDPQYYMAARVDAAPQHRVFFHITVPLVSPMIVYVFILEIINSFKVYTEIYSLFGGKAGPANSVMTVVFYIYDQFYGNFNFSVAAAAAVVLFFIILLVTLLQLRITRKKYFIIDAPQRERSVCNGCKSRARFWESTDLPSSDGRCRHHAAAFCVDDSVLAERPCGSDADAAHISPACLAL